MTDSTGVRISFIGLELDREADENRLVWDYYTGQKLVDSFFLKDQDVSHSFDFTEDFQFVRIVIRSMDERVPIGETLLTFSFLNEWESNSGNDQWLPLAQEEGIFLVAKDFNAYEAERPWIRLRFELLNTYTGSPIREQESKSYEQFSMRSPYGYEQESQAPRRSTHETQKTLSGYKTASLRRRDHGQNLPLPVDEARARALNKYEFSLTV